MRRGPRLNGISVPQITNRHRCSKPDCSAWLTHRADRENDVRRKDSHRRLFLKTTNRLKNYAVGSGAMRTSTSNVFCRVNRRRPCRICGKPDWCVFVRDETLSVCMRVSDGARKINRHGGAIFIHDDWREEKGIDVRAVTNIPQSPIAPVEIRDFVYGRLIDLSPATLYPDALIAGEKGLLARGFDERHFDNYGGLPAGSRERDHIARLLLQEIKDRFPNADSLHCIPGFWKDGQGTHLWKPKDYLLPRLLIPVLDGSGRIQSC